MDDSKFPKDNITPAANLRERERERWRERERSSMIHGHYHKRHLLGSCAYRFPETRLVSVTMLLNSVLDQTLRSLDGLQGRRLGNHHVSSIMNKKHRGRRGGVGVGVRTCGK